MPALYIVLEKEIPNTDTFVNGNLISKNNEALEKLAKGAGVLTLMDFFSTNEDEVAALLGEDNLPQNVRVPEEQWFAAEDGLRTVRALLDGVGNSAVCDRDRVESELREFEAVLELAKSNGIRWHLAVDY